MFALKLVLTIIWDRFREKGPNAYIINFPVRAIDV